MILKNELNWLSRHFKSYSLPLVVYNPSSFWSGYYQWPSYIEGCPINVEIGDNLYPNHHGIIVLSNPSPDVIAHEYRHHLQCEKYGFWNVPNEIRESKDAFIHYYQTCPYEQDALRFEMSLYPDEATMDTWCSILNLEPISRSSVITNL